jgi:phenylacetate-coenzyme A ligase PaaK-like adenylate-forming protein
MLQVLSVHTALGDLVNALNRFRPVLVAPYASLASQLASEQEAGRLQIQPALLTLSAEGLPVPEYDRIASVFGAKVGNSYAASECMFLSYDCRERWLHVNADWVVVEPVNADYSPTPPGEQSHTVLITNLANRTQPILRYDLGDSVLQRPDPCPCGNPLPAIRPRGRTADALTFPSLRGEPIKVPLLAFGADVQGVEQFQIVQAEPTTLRVRLRVAAEADGEHIWKAVRAEIARVLAANGLDHVAVERTNEPPQLTPGGKFREIIPFSAANPND